VLICVVEAPVSAVSCGVSLRAVCRLRPWPTVGSWCGGFRLHKSLANSDPRARAMAAGLADHVWTCEEIAALLDRQPQLTGTKLVSRIGQSQLWLSGSGGSSSRSAQRRLSAALPVTCGYCTSAITCLRMLLRGHTGWRSVSRLRSLHG